MADVSKTVMTNLWNATRGYSWESLRQGLNTISANNSITPDMYNDMLWAINKLESIGSNFPTSDDELYNKMSYYM